MSAVSCKTIPLAELEVNSDCAGHLPLYFPHLFLSNVNIYEGRVICSSNKEFEFIKHI